MKKQFLLTAVLFAVSLTASAQLKVYSDGKVGIARTSSSGIHKFSIGESGLYGSYDISLFCNSKINSQDFIIGVQGHSVCGKIGGGGRSFGVRGIAGGATDGWNYGVLGGLNDSRKGAGIFGTVYSHTGVQMDKRYAGYFDGPTHVDGELVVTGGIQGLLLAPEISQNIQNPRTVSTNAFGESTVIDRLSNVSMFSYYKSQPAESRRSLSETGDTITHEPSLSFIAKQELSKQHYALSIEQLEKSFPDLVYEQADGTKAVNYMEIIPLLVQSLNELHERLLIAEEKSTFKSRQSSMSTSSVSTASTVVTSLKQNTPNPFSESTTIRFTLPSDVQNAYIYIFDMSGKMQKNIPVDASMNSITVNAYEFSEGMYIYSLIVDGKEIDTKRMILTK